MGKELEILSVLGFKNKWVSNRDGISVYIPEDLHSNDWCLSIPNGLEFDGVKQDFNLYSVPFQTVLNVLNNNVSPDKVKALKEYLSQNNKAFNKKVNKNCLANYKEKRNLTYKELGAIAGITRQRAEQICKTNIRDITIEPFAKYEGISVKEFRRAFS